MRIDKSFSPFRYCNLSALLILMIAGGRLAADVTATVDVPNGTTNFPGFVQWTLNDPGELSTFFELEISPGMSANQIASGMDFEIDNAFGFEGMLSGNMVTVEDVIGNLATAPGEIDITWEVELPPGPGVTPLNVPLTAAPRPGDAPILSLFLAGPDGSSIPVAGGMLLEIDYTVITTGDQEFSDSIVLDVPAGEPTETVNLILDSLLQSNNHPSELQYVGLNNGFPTFAAVNGFKLFKIRMYGRSQDDTGVQMGYILQPPILMGDINCDGLVNLLDVQPFVDLLTNGGYSAKADFNDDGLVNLLDVEGFIDALSG